MRVVRQTATGIKAVASMPVAASRPGVRVAVTSAGICGSDLHSLAAGAISGVPGHEFGGRLDDGTLVAVQPFAPCGRCDECRHGAGHLCAPGLAGFHGASLDGGLADEAWVDQRMLVPVPAGVRPEDVAMVEPIAVSVHAVNRARVAVGERALVIGGGTIGLLCAAVLRERGAEVTIAARHPRQLQAAEALGLRTEQSGRYPLVVDAAGSTTSFAQATKLAQRGGRIVLVALPWEPLDIGFATVFKEVDVLPSIYYSRTDFEDAAAFLGRHPEIPAELVTHRFGLDDASEAFRAAGERGAGSIKVLVIP